MGIDIKGAYQAFRAWYDTLRNVGPFYLGPELATEIAANIRKNVTRMSAKTDIDEKRYQDFLAWLEEEDDTDAPKREADQTRCAKSQ